ncbi:hypothetical protein ABVT39_022957 [Epinephelus coioides]
MATGGQWPKECHTNPRTKTGPGRSKQATKRRAEPKQQRRPGNSGSKFNHFEPHLHSLTEGQRRDTLGLQHKITTISQERRNRSKRKEADNADLPPGDTTTPRRDPSRANPSPRHQQSATLRQEEDRVTITHIKWKKEAAVRTLPMCRERKCAPQWQTRQQPLQHSHASSTTPAQGPTHQATATTGVQQIREGEREARTVWPHYIAAWCGAAPAINQCFR